MYIINFKELTSVNIIGICFVGLQKQVVSLTGLFLSFVP